MSLLPWLVSFCSATTPFEVLKSSVKLSSRYPASFPSRVALAVPVS